LRKIAAACRKVAPFWRQVDWPICSVIHDKASRELKAIYIRHQARLYRKNLKPDRKLLLEEKGLAQDLFKGKKPTYLETLTKNYKGDQVGLAQNPNWTKFALGN
jgi:hypothetical protein